MRDREPEFEQFVHDHYSELLRYAVMVTGRRWDAEEVVQEALLRCLRRWRRVPAHNALAYARRVVFNEVMRSAKRRSTTADPIQEFPDFAGDIAERHQVLMMLRQLPPRQRAAVVARFFLDLSEAQAASELGCSVGTVKSLTSRGLARLRQLWSTTPATTAVISARGTHK